MSSLKIIISNLINKFLNNFSLRIIYSKDYIFNHSKYEMEAINLCKQYSMTGGKRMSNLTKCIKFISENKINGDFVECGVWKGGNLILMQRLVDHYGLNKKIYGYDTFNGMTEPNEFDVNINDQKASKLLMNERKIENNDDMNIWCYSGLQTVKDNFSKNTKNNNLTLVKGDVKNTLNNKSNLPKEISLLRLDTDFYESTKIELEILYPLVVKNGIIIIDDYGHWKGQRKALDEYFLKQNITNYLFEVDYSCRVFIKN